MYMYSSFIVVYSYSILIFLRLFVVYSLSLPTDDSDFNNFLFDDSLQPFLGGGGRDDENGFLSMTTTTTADATPGNNPCVAANGADTNQQEEEEEDTMNLFSRAADPGGPQCLPPVNIGAETLHLFESPLDTLNNILLPHSDNPPTPDALPPLSYPGLLPDGETSTASQQSLDELGAQPYTGLVEQNPSPACQELTAHLGSFPYDLCCDGKEVDYGWRSVELADRMLGLDRQTVANGVIRRTYDCIRTSLCFVSKPRPPPPPPPFFFLFSHESLL